MRIRVIDLRVTSAQTLEVDDRGVLEVFAATEPLELIARLRATGFAVESSGREDGAWCVRAGKGALPPLEDLTDLEAPEPMQRVLAAFASLGKGDVFLALLPHRPAPLLPLLDARGASWEVALRPDGKAVLWLSR